MSYIEVLFKYYNYYCNINYNLDNLIYFNKFILINF